MIRRIVSVVSRVGCGKICFGVCWVFVGILCMCSSVAADGISSPPQAVSSKKLQQILDRLVARNLQRHPCLTLTDVHVALMDLADPDRPEMAHFNGHEPVYPSSVIKMVYMGYVFQLASQGKLTITPEVYQKLHQMIQPSSNAATAWIVDLWSGASGGDLRSPEAYREFAFKRNACNRWLSSIGIKGINACQKTWGSPIPPGERQFLRGGTAKGPWVNRNSMTAAAAARFLQFIAQDALVDKKSCDGMRRLMERDVKKQRYQRMRIAGGAPAGARVFSKTGTTSDTFHDAGIVVLPDGHTFVLTIFITGPCRTGFIRDTAHDIAAWFMSQGPERSTS
jgi:beta-lactamase class A